MSVATPTVVRLQDQHDVNVTVGAGVDEYALCWDNDTARFVLRAMSAALQFAIVSSSAIVVNQGEIAWQS